MLLIFNFVFFPSLLSGTDNFLLIFIFALFSLSALAYLISAYLHYYIDYHDNPTGTLYLEDTLNAIQVLEQQLRAIHEHDQVLEQIQFQLQANQQAAQQAEQQQHEHQD